MNRPGRTARTAKKDDAFFAAMSSGLPIGECCTIAGYARTCVYGYREKDAEFARRWQEADEAAVERMEKEADRRAIEGTEEPVFHQGVECGRIRKFSDTLLIFRLKAKRPAVYRERASIEHSGPGGGPISVDLDLRRKAAKELEEFEKEQGGQ